MRTSEGKEGDGRASRRAGRRKLSMSLAHGSPTTCTYPIRRRELGWISLFRLLAFPFTRLHHQCISDVLMICGRMIGEVESMRMATDTKIRMGWGKVGPRMSPVGAPGYRSESAAGGADVEEGGNACGVGRKGITVAQGP